MKHLYYILTTDRRSHDRLPLVAEAAHNAGIPYEVFVGQDKLTGLWPATDWRHNPGYWFAGQSHRAVWNLAYSAGADHVTVFEDDANIPVDFLAMQNMVLSKLISSWHGCYWGYIHREQPKAVGDGIIQLRLATQMHAYTLSRAGMLRSYSHTTADWGTVIDWAMAGLQKQEGHFFAPAEPVVNTLDMGSDNHPVI